VDAGSACLRHTTPWSLAHGQIGGRCTTASRGLGLQQSLLCCDQNILDHLVYGFGGDVSVQFSVDLCLAPALAQASQSRVFRAGHLKGSDPVVMGVEADDSEPLRVVGSAEAVHKFTALGTVDGLR
jgi:hypothetical protein